MDTNNSNDKTIYDRYLKVLNSSFYTNKNKKKVLDRLFLESSEEKLDEYNYDVLRNVLNGITNKSTLKLIGDNYADNILSCLDSGHLWVQNIKIDMVTNSFMDTCLKNSKGLLYLLKIFDNDDFDKNISKLAYPYDFYVKNKVNNLTNNDLEWLYFSDDAVKYIVSNISKFHLLSLFENSSISDKIKNYVLETRLDDLKNYIDNAYRPYQNLVYHFYEYPPQVLDMLIMRIPNNELLSYLSSDMPEERKDRIYELRKEELEKISVSDDEIFDKYYIGKYLDYLLRDKDEYFIARLLLYDIGRCWDKKKQLLKMRSNVIKNYFYRNEISFGDNLELRKLLNLQYFWDSDELKEINDYLWKIFNINYIIVGSTDVNKIDKILEFDDEHIIGAFIRYSDNSQYSNLLVDLYNKKKELFNDYLKSHPDEFTLLSYIPINFDDIKRILLEVPCLPVFIKCLHYLDDVEFINKVLDYLYTNNTREINEYFESNPLEYFWLDPRSEELSEKIISNISDKNAIYLLFKVNREEIEKVIGNGYIPWSSKKIIYEKKKDVIINYLNNNPIDILSIPSFIDFNSFIDDVLAKLSDTAVIECLCNSKIIDKKIYKDSHVGVLLGTLFGDRKNKIYEYLDKNNIGYEFLFYYDIPGEDIPSIINKIDDDKLLDIFVNFGINSFKEKEELLNVIYQNKKDLILGKFIEDNDKYSFVLKLKISDDDFDNIIETLDRDSLYRMFNSRLYSIEIRKKVLRLLLMKNNIDIDEGFIDDVFSMWKELAKKGNDKLIINNIGQLNDFMNRCHLSFNKMFQYEANADYNWIKGIMDIINSDKMDTFIKVKNKFFNIYFNLDGSESEIPSYESLLILIKNFNRYPELCTDIVNNRLFITDEEKNNISFLFGLNDDIDIKGIEGLNSINSILKEKYLSYLNNIDDFDLLELKGRLSNIIFNKNYEMILSYLKVYGNRENFIRLRFNNRNNKEILDYIDEMLVYVSFIEDFVNCDDLDSLKDIANNISNYFEKVSNISIIFNDFENKMRNLFEIEANINLTDISNKEIYNKVLNKELSDKYGVDVLDFRDKEYLFYAHVVSGKENIEDLVEGKSSSGSNFISLSAIGNRNNRYYWGGNHGIKVLYSKIKKGSYVMSSVSNMSSNNLLSKNSTKVIETEREQRGLIENVDAPGSNSEAIYYRDGLIPSGFNTYEGDRYFDEAIEEAKKYGLPIILTQGKNKTITNPIPLEEEKIDDISDKDKYKELRDKLNKLANLKPNNSNRKIAILTDPHALFEPTLAILEDTRKEGITEIYSLGDNIGTGPNPGEVVDLLERYNVKSVKGNHELYTLVGTDQFKDHLHGSALKEAEENSTWTRLHLTDRQLEIIRNYPDKREINVGGKKVLLTHYINDLNTNKVVVDKDNYDKIFQGHIHYKREEDNISTLRGVGIGSKSNNEKAYYIILTESDDGGFDIEEKYVSFDTNSLYHEINESSLSEHDKSKITSWSRVGRR